MLFGLLVIGFGIQGCKDQGSASDEEQTSDSLLVIQKRFQELPDPVEIDAETREKMADFTMFAELEQEMEKFRNKSTGDLSFSVEQLKNIDQRINRDSLPGALNNPAIKSRLTLMRTYLRLMDTQLKQAGAESQVDSARVKLYLAYNGLRYQINDVLREKIYEAFLDSTVTGSDTLP